MGVTRGSEADDHTTPARQVWLVDLGQPSPWVNAASLRLAAGELTFDARATPVVRRRRLLARAALRGVLSHYLSCSPDALSFARGRHGKPRLADDDPGGGVHFNLSRSGDWCLIGVSTAGPIGVDIERVLAFDELEQVVANRFAAVEAAAILRFSGERRLRAFYNCWTRKEAYLKGTGVGLTGSLDRVVVSVGDRRPAILSLADADPADWSLASLSAGPKLVGSVAWRGAEGNALL